MRGATLLVTLMVSTSGCSAIITISEDEIRCAGEGADDPCPDGRRCRDGFCQLIGFDSGRPDVPDGGCVPDDRGEICNGEDDDCDGVIDNGQDEDMDGFTWCGGGIANRADCDDNDPNAHPGDAVILAATERCDGADNDCDGEIDEDDGSGLLCSGGLSCIDRVYADPTDCSLPSVTCATGDSCDFDLTPPRCVAGGCTAASCTIPEICNTETGDCVTPAQIGEACDTDTDCDGGAICILRAALGLPGARICTKPCCVDAECPDETVCWASGTGVKLCVPPAMVGTSAGTGEGGSMCTSPSSCTSGICLDDSTCLDNCGNDGDCSGGLACTATVIPSSPDRVQFGCGTPGGSVTQGDVDFGGGCASRFSRGSACLVTFPFTCGPICIGPCRTSEDCPSSIIDVEYYCGFGGAAMYDSMFAQCTPKRHMGTGENGATCTSNSGCRDQTCFLMSKPESSGCADTCCSNEDCSRGRCRPIEIRGQWETHCI